MKRFAKAILATSLGLTLGLGLLHGTRVWAGPGTDKIAICHGTASVKNPYVLIHVAPSAINGHFDGTAPGHGKNNHPDELAKNGSCSTTPPPTGPPNNS